MRERSVWDADRFQAALNVAGGAAFSVGSLLLLDRGLAPLGVIFFVAGSFAMLAGALVVWRERYGARARAARAAEAVTSPAAPGSSPGSPPGD